MFYFNDQCRKGQKGNEEETEQNSSHLLVFFKGILRFPFYKMLSCNNGNHCPLDITLRVLNKSLLSSYSSTSHISNYRDAIFVTIKKCIHFLDAHKETRIK